MDMNDPRILALLSELQGLDTEDENVSRKREWARALREQSQQQPYGRAVMYGQEATVPAGWAGAAAQIGQGLMGGWGEYRANQMQSAADAKRSAAAKRWLELMQGGMQRPPGAYSPMRPMRGPYQ